MADSTPAYCPVCKAAAPVAAAACPRCGTPLVPAPESPSDPPSNAPSGPPLDLDQTAQFDAASPTRELGAGPPTADERVDSLVGRQLHVYQCVALLGKGGMGHVFVARHQDLDRQCALKILSPKAVRRDLEYVRRFQHEGRSAASLVHSNITTIHAIGEAEGLHFLEMEFLAGGTLQQLVRRERQLDPARAASLVAQVASGLAAAHDQQIVHRDLKPENILLTTDLHPKIADFGLAKRIVQDASPRQALAGTPNYMAPELLRGASPTPTSDVYALGVTFYTLLTGGLPYEVASFPHLLQTLATAPPPELPSDVFDAETAECVARMMARRPEDRIGTGREALAAVSNLLTHLRDMRQLLTLAFAGDKTLQWRQEGETYLVQVRLPGGRGQEVRLQPGVSNDGSRLLLILSLCCDAQPAFYETALRLNAEMAHGGLALREIDGRWLFCVVDTYPWATVDVEEIAMSTREVARQADAVEHCLTGQDVQ